MQGFKLNESYQSNNCYGLKEMCNFKMVFMIQIVWSLHSF